MWANHMLCTIHLLSFVFKFRILLPRDVGNRSAVPEISSISWHQDVLYLLCPVFSSPLLFPSVLSPFLLPLFSSSLASSFEVTGASQPCYMGRHTILQTEMQPAILCEQTHYTTNKRALPKSWCAASHVFKSSYDHRCLFAVWEGGSSPSFVTPRKDV